MYLCILKKTKKTKKQNRWKHHFLIKTNLEMYIL